MLPSLDALRKRAAKEERVVVDPDPKKSSIVKVRPDEILVKAGKNFMEYCMPYVLTVHLHVARRTDQ